MAADLSRWHDLAGISPALRLRHISNACVAVIAAQVEQQTQRQVVDPSPVVVREFAEAFVLGQIGDAVAAGKRS
ncbi:hypothetical protein ACQPZ2_01410 [Nocardia pseudovaccinii]|uniref:hypothetical protein n=1 Tax=Nocardia pseudovaccinii TaxID=189540 RepID=UPI003D943061